MDQDATQTGVSEEQEAPKPTRNPREDLVEAIAARAAMQRDIALGLAEKTVDEEPAAEASEEVQEDKKSEPSEELVKLVVDGQEKEVPISQLIETGKRAMQKELAADKRLEEASRLLREARERDERALREANTAPKPDATATHEDPEKVSSWVKAIQYGDEKEAAAAIQEIMGTAGRATATLTPEAIRMAVDQRIREQAIVHRFETEFGDIVSDPYLVSMAVHKVDELLQSGEYRNDWELYRKAGDSVREWRDKIAGKPKEDKSDMDDRRARKRELDTVKSVNAKAESSKQEPQRQTPQEIFLEMKRARGQAV